ncbi:PE-PGRS family protein [Streptomyces phaeolivaceus]|uniref:PE-PGRS family protein n=1 Tax=Streptomyces phaeolivaceus TaxID=2653200 RepID=A0A5P8KHC7_9ACTN|nr:PE-PGRS family protein [Streptomyces phaeolivaceus]QFR02193.1 PE-PGRS family protein [Streptomyces phaeolivaceus]
MHTQRQQRQQWEQGRDGRQRRSSVPSRTVDDPTGLLALQHAAGNRAVAATVQRVQQQQEQVQEQEIEAGPPPDEASLQTSTDPDAVIVRLARSSEQHARQKKRKFNIWEPHKKWPEDWLLPEAKMRWVLERRLVLGEVFREQELKDIELLSEKRPAWLNSVGIGTMADGHRIAAGQKRAATEANKSKNSKGKGDSKGKGKETAAEKKPDYSDWLKLTPGRRILAASLAFETQRPASGAPIPINPAYTLGRFMRTQALPEDSGDRRELEAERDTQIRETALDTLVPASVRDDQRHPEAKDLITEDHKAQDGLARDVLTNVLLILRHGLQYTKNKKHVDYREGDVIRALAHGGRVNIRIPALQDGENPNQLLDFLGVPKVGKEEKRVMERGFATHRSSVGANKGETSGRFAEKGGVGASLTNVASKAVPGVTTPKLLGINQAIGGIGTKDWNGDVVLPNGSYGHMLLVFTEPTASTDGSLLVGIETIAPHAASPVGYHHGVKSTEATANPESSLHGHKPDKIGDGKMKNNQRLVELGKMGGTGQSWHAFLDELKTDWADRLAAAHTPAEERELYGELVGPRP